MRTPALFTETIQGFKVEVFSSWPDDYCKAEICIQAIDAPKIRFVIKTNFFVKRPSSIHSEHYVFYFKQLPYAYEMKGYRVDVKNDVLMVYNTETKLRICRIPIELMKMFIKKCNDMVSVQPSTTKYTSSYYYDIQLPGNNKELHIALEAGPGGISSTGIYGNGYYSKENTEVLCDWVTTIDHEETPPYDLIVMEHGDQLNKYHNEHL